MRSVTDHSGITIKTPTERDAMRAAGQASAQVLLMIEPHVRWGRHHR
jgi:methionine aminopeptidase